MAEDNPTTQDDVTQDNSSDPTVTGTETGAETTTLTNDVGFSWKSQLRPDLRNSPLAQKFGDDVDGFNKAVESHANLEKLLGHEKVVIPKGDDDVAGWNQFQKAMGIPDKAEQYGLADVELPESMKDISFGKEKFAEVVHSIKATPAQAKGLWEAYTTMQKEAYQRAIQSNEKQMTDVVNQLRSEWGDTYDTNVELGQMVINKFASDKDSESWLTANMLKNPYGVKFLAKLGNQFAENKVGEFGFKRFSLSGEEAQAEIDKIIGDPNHPYSNLKATPAEHERAMDYVNSLYKVINKAKNR